jgi:TRAP transporter TAXI family solute receptor
MIEINRRQAMTLLAAGAGSTVRVTLARAESSRLSLMTAGQGSAFLPYGQGIAAVLTAAGVAQVDVRESKGSNENLSAVNASPTIIGAAFLGSAFDALRGVGFAAGARHDNIRALFPMYETAFMTAALASRGISSIGALDGKRVGCGPAKGPAEGYFRAVAGIAGVTPLIVSGTPADQAKQLINSEIDAFWQGASVPIPSLASVANAADCVVFGLAKSEIAQMRTHFPFMADAAYPPDTYRGQAAKIETVAAWNVVIAHKDLDEGLAYNITKAVLTAKDLQVTAGAAASSTNASNASKNTVVPYHAGAIRALAELGVKVQ